MVDHAVSAPLSPDYLRQFCQAVRFGAATDYCLPQTEPRCTVCQMADLWHVDREGRQQAEAKAETLNDECRDWVRRASTVAIQLAIAEAERDEANQAFEYAQTGGLELADALETAEAALHDARAKALRDVRVVWDAWRLTLKFGAFSHSDGLAFVQLLDSLAYPVTDAESLP